ncbi:MAG: sulfatase-like hydrolase/transferase [candidate division Zixibacteria bacterium]|nr:sulfatase-like hydrolase/transferase [candidate division Zixibacteria bacterium]
MERMFLKLKKFILKDYSRKRNFQVTLTAGLFGGCLAALIEPAILGIKFYNSMWDFMFHALFYYGLIGLAIGATAGLLLLIPWVLNIRIKLAIIFLGVGSFVTIYLLFPYYPDFSVFFDIRGPAIKIIYTSFLFALFFAVSGFIYFLGSIFKRGYLKLYIFVYIIPLVFSCFTYHFGFSSVGDDNNIETTADGSIENRTNIIIILLDSVRYDRMNADFDNICFDKLGSVVEDAVVYSNVFAASFWTKPAVASLMASVFPSEHEVMDYSSVLKAKSITLAEKLDGHGYLNTAFSTNTNIMAGFGFAQGFDHFKYIQPPNALFGNYKVFKLRRVFQIENNLKALIRDIRGWDWPAYYYAEHLTDTVLEWINTNQSERFFIYIHYMDPHSPYYEHPYNDEFAYTIREPHTEADVTYMTELYNGELTYSGSHVRRLIDDLKDKNLYDSTMIIITADHGEELYDHYAWDHIMSMYDELIHIPLIIKYPGNQWAGTIDSSLISQVDIAPTILDYIGIETPESWHGQSFLNGARDREYVLSQWRGIQSIRTTRYKYMFTSEDYALKRLEEPRLKYIEKRAAFPEHNFFDLISDPHEKDNLYGTPLADSLITEMIEIVDTTLFMELSGTTKTDTTTLDEATKNRLRALGYLE